MNRNRRFPTDCSNTARRKTFVGSLGFTLVELLVVIAIIGVLVALLLPAVQAARESARRTQCMNQMRQMMIAAHNHESARKFFPTGGIQQWPLIENYSAGGRPFAAPKQGLSWAFQLLPYLEQNAIHNITTQQELAETPVAMYFCPSRRPPTFNSVHSRWLMDYAALIGAPTFGQSEELGWAFPRASVASNQDYVTQLNAGEFCKERAMWGGKHGLDERVEFDPSLRAPIVFPTQGVIARSSYKVLGTGSSRTTFDLGLPGPTAMRQISDGTSNTIVLCEKRVDINRPDGPYTDDDAGWSDGWDYDTLRLASCRPTGDATKPEDVGIEDEEIITAGSAHPSVLICGFADASMHAISYDIDLATFNLLANKSDGESLDPEAL